jgi:hypothetical protein
MQWKLLVGDEAYGRRAIRVAFRILMVALGTGKMLDGGRRRTMWTRRAWSLCHARRRRLLKAVLGAGGRSFSRRRERVGGRASARNEGRARRPPHRSRPPAPVLTVRRTGHPPGEALRPA